MKLNAAQKRQIKSIVGDYQKDLARFKKFADVLLADLNEFKPLLVNLHSIKGRVKDVDHLAEKIDRKSDKYFTRAGRFKLNYGNLPFLVNDLVGVRLIHLYTRQFDVIDEALHEFFMEYNYVLREGPTARVWDSEQKSYFEKLNIDTKDSPNLYSSVHYVIGTSDERGLTAEIQVRTLADELWGEVDHKVNYPEKSKSAECMEQIAVLARLTSGASRLTDSIFLSHEISLGSKIDK